MIRPIAAIFFGLTATLGTSDALAQKYPERPVRIILPFGAGGVADVTAPLVAEKLIIENQPGAGGIAAARAVMGAPPDGHTLALFSNGTAVSVGLFKSLPFDPIKDFVPVSSMGYFDLVLATSATGPYRTLGDFVKAAKEKPGQLNVGTITAGSTQNLAAELLKSTAGIDFVVVPYRNSGEVLVALERNDVQLAFEFLAPLRAGLDAGKFVAVAVSGANRAEYLPHVTTAKEAGGGDFEATSWNAIYAPAATPPEVVRTLNSALREVLSDAAVKRKALELGIEARASTPDEIQARLIADIAKWSAVIDKAGIEKR
jgi:tripartite-type tricarboxylate transporter receptor subunit TctC